MAEKQCETCPSPAIRGERFCKLCRKAVLLRLREEGYLTTVPWGSGRGRTTEQREDVRETRHGLDR